MKKYLSGFGSYLFGYAIGLVIGATSLGILIASGNVKIENCFEK